MSENAGIRIALGLGIAALLVVIALILEQVAGESDEPPEASATASAPTDLQFCAGWRQLSKATAPDRATPAESETVDVTGALTAVREMGFPASMGPLERAGLQAAVDELAERVDPSFEPTAYPAEPDEDEAFEAFLAERCPG